MVLGTFLEHCISIPPRFALMGSFQPFFSADMIFECPFVFYCMYVVCCVFVFLFLLLLLLEVFLFCFFIIISSSSSSLQRQKKISIFVCFHYDENKHKHLKLNVVFYLFTSWAMLVDVFNPRKTCTKQIHYIPRRWRVQHSWFSCKKFTSTHR